MPTLAAKPTLAVTAITAIVMSATGLSTAARAADATSGTGPAPITSTAGPHRGGGPGANLATLAGSLGVSVSDLRAAMDAIRDDASAGDSTDETATEVKTVASALGVDESVIQSVLDAQKPTASGTTPHGPRGGRVSVQDATLITAIAAATGKDQAAVQAALEKADAVRAAARQQRDLEFAKKLAARLHLDQDKVLNAVETARPAAPARAARQGTAQQG